MVAYSALIVESCDAISSPATAQQKYAGANVAQLSQVSGRIRASGWHMVGSGNNGIGIFLDPTGASAAYSKIVAGFGYRVTAAGEALSICSLRTGTGGNRDFELIMDGSGHVRTRRNGTTIATGTTALTTNTWYYLEFKVQMSTTSGSIEVRINGVTEAALTVSAAQTAAANSATVFQLGVANSVSEWDDLVVQDWSVAGVDFLGDVSVSALYALAAGNYAQFAPLSSTNVSNVDEHGVNDGDTTYNSDATVGDRDSFTHDAFPTNGTPYIIQVTSVVRRDDAGAKTSKTFVRDASASTDYDGATWTLGTSYIGAREIFNSDPAGGAWTQANAEDDEIGYKVQA